MTQRAIHFQRTTTLTPEQYVAGLTDFGPGRSKLFGNSADDYLKVHSRGRSEADVTEGSGGIWERLHYDWSEYVMARTLRDGCSGPWSEPSAGAFWKGRLKTPSKPSKPGTVRAEMKPQRKRGYGPPYSFSV